MCLIVYIFRLISNYLLKNLYFILVHLLILGDGILNKIQNIKEFINHIWYDIKVSIDTRVYYNYRKECSSSIKRIYYFYLYASEVKNRLPKTIRKFIYRRILFTTPQNLEEFQEIIPPSNLPESVGILLKLNKSVIHILQNSHINYLLKNNIKYQIDELSIDIKSSVDIHWLKQLSLEKMRVLNDIGKFIVWNSLIPNIRYVNIYEEYGIIWYNESVSDIMELIKQSIQSGFNSLLDNYNSTNYNGFIDLIPQITLKDIESEKLLAFNPTIPLEKLDIINAPQDPSISKRELMVYFSDKRSRSERILKFANATTGDTITNDKVHDIAPPPVNLLLLPEKGYLTPLTTLGYFTIPYADNEIESVVYTSCSKLNFKMYSKSLYHYSMVVYMSLDSEIVPESSNQSIQSSLGSQYLISFIERLMSLRIFDIRSSKDQEVPMHIDTYSPFFYDDEVAPTTAINTSSLIEENFSQVGI